MSSFEQRAASVASLGIFTARIVAFDVQGTAFVVCTGHDTAPRPARSTVPLNPGLLGAEVVIGFDAGDRAAPLIIGVVQPQGSLPQRISLDAAGSIEIACGRSAIVLHEDGKIVLSGEYIISRARRTNRLEGGAVQIN